MPACVCMHTHAPTQARAVTHTHARADRDTRTLICPRTHTHLLLLAGVDEAVAGLDVEVGRLVLADLKRHRQQRIGVGKGHQLVRPAVRGHVAKVQELRTCRHGPHTRSRA